MMAMTVLMVVCKQRDRTKNSLGREKIHKNLSGKWLGGVAADETDYGNYRSSGG